MRSTCRHRHPAISPRVALSVTIGTIAVTLRYFGYRQWYRRMNRTFFLISITTTFATSSYTMQFQRT